MKQFRLQLILIPFFYFYFSLVPYTSDLEVEAVLDASISSEGNRKRNTLKLEEKLMRRPKPVDLTEKNILEPNCMYLDQKKKKKKAIANKCSTINLYSQWIF
jgi:hypothetical protein